MAPQLDLLQSKPARRLVADLIEAGWDVEISYGDGIISRRGRQLQDVPWCQLRATRQSRQQKVLCSKVKDWNRERAELEAASELLSSLRGTRHREPGKR